MASTKMFFDKLLERHESWRHFPIIERKGAGWRGIALHVPPPPGSDLCGPLDIERICGEVTITLDYSHAHVPWPPMKKRRALGKVWAEPFALIDAILHERVISLSGWIDDDLREGSLQEVVVDRPLQFHAPKLQRLRIRSWKGAFDRDVELTPEQSGEYVIALPKNKP